MDTYKKPIALSKHHLLVVIHFRRLFPKWLFAFLKKIFSYISSFIKIEEKFNYTQNYQYNHKATYHNPPHIFLLFIPPIFIIISHILKAFKSFSPHHPQLPVLFFLYPSQPLLHDPLNNPPPPVKAISTDRENAVVCFHKIVACPLNNGFCQIVRNKCIYTLADLVYFFFVH